MNFLWTTIHTNKYKESLDFYENVIGLKIDSQFESKAGEITMFDLGNAKLEFIESDKDPQFDGLSIGLEVESLEEKLEEFSDFDILGPISPNENISFFFITDPNGMQVQFVENK